MKNIIIAISVFLVVGCSNPVAVKNGSVKLSVQMHSNAGEVLSEGFAELIESKNHFSVMFPTLKTESECDLPISIVIEGVPESGPVATSVPVFQGGKYEIGVLCRYDKITWMILHEDGSPVYAKGNSGMYGCNVSFLKK